METETFDARTGVRDEAIVPDGYKRHDVTVAKGSVVFIHGYVIHGSHANASEQFRYALLNTYLYPNTPFRVGRTGERHEFPLPRKIMAHA